jgi:secreted PhoX family phosphatase
MVFRGLLNFVERFRPREKLIDQLAIEFLQDHEPEEAYQQARQVMRLSRDQRDWTMEKLHAKVAVRIAAITGRRIAGKDAGEELYGQPTRMIDGTRTMRI